jgi:DNA-binding NarL/FixJ family response regulator
MNDRIISDPIKVLMADDHTLFRQGLAGLLASYGGMEVVGETNNDRGAIELAQKTKPDVVIMQVQLPFERARESLAQLRQIWPSPKIIIVTMFEQPYYLRAFLHLGIRAYLLKRVSIEELIGTIRAAAFDPEGENVVIGMPRQMIEQA